MTIRPPEELSRQSALHYAEAVTHYSYDLGWPMKAAEAAAYVECAKPLIEYVFEHRPNELGAYLATTTISKCPPQVFEAAQEATGLFADDLWAALHPLLGPNDGNRRPKAQGFGN